MENIARELDTVLPVSVSLCLQGLNAFVAILGQGIRQRGGHQKKDVIRCLPKDIQEQQRQIFPDHAPTFTLITWNTFAF
ncbi:MAG TPA: hypothetical protein VF884_16265 [Nitrososphaeraceae archaeon]